MRCRGNGVSGKRRELEEKGQKRDRNTQKNKSKGSVQPCVECRIDVFRVELVIYQENDQWSTYVNIRIALHRNIITVLTIRIAYGKNCFWF